MLIIKHIFHRVYIFSKTPLTYWLWPRVCRPTSGAIGLKFTALGSIEPNYRMQWKFFWFDHPGRKSNVILISDIWHEKSKKSSTWLDHTIWYIYHSIHLILLYKMSWLNLRFSKMSNFGKLIFFSPLAIVWNWCL